jgi:hypothetical protein
MSTEKPKQYWIIPAETRLQDHEIWTVQPGVRNSPNRFTHVIEHAAYAKVVEALRDLYKCKYGNELRWPGDSYHDFLAKHEAILNEALEHK